MPGLLTESWGRAWVGPAFDHLADVHFTMTVYPSLHLSSWTQWVYARNTWVVMIVLIVHAQNTARIRTVHGCCSCAYVWKPARSNETGSYGERERAWARLKSAHVTVLSLGLQMRQRQPGTEQCSVSDWSRVYKALSDKIVAGTIGKMPSVTVRNLERMGQEHKWVPRDWWEEALKQ